MTVAEERRTPGSERVEVTTLVEICGNRPGIPPFEAQTVDVSDRGMHLRTAYLPEQGAPLICRFEENGREIVVEGLVAWRRESSRGGEFGVEFTALDSKSVGALRDLCGRNSPPTKGRERAKSLPDAQRAEPGTRVRLHIDGLAAPMKARVRKSGTQQVQVGSNLEFLKVGRPLEIEDIEQGARSRAQIDSVSVAVDPQTQVPQLVVALRYDGQENTPEPSVADLDAKEAAKFGFKIDGDAVTLGDRKSKAAKAKASDELSDDDSDDDTEAEALALKGTIGQLASNAGDAMKNLGSALANASSSASAGLGQLLQSFKRKPETKTRRTTAPAPARSVADGPRLRPQSKTPQAAESAPMSRATKIAVASGGLALLSSIALFALRPSATPPGATALATNNGSPNAAQAPQAAVPSMGPRPLSTASNAARGPVTANLPLFGPTPMSTVEPAQAAPDPASLEAQERAAARSSRAAQLGGGLDDDEGDAPSGNGKHGSSKDTRPEDVPPWGHGKLHSPVVHRLRLDGPASALHGEQGQKSFTVTIPGRKIMESPAAIAKGDNRISKARSSNTSSGAELTFNFSSQVPAYRVRLRRDYVEILLSEDKSKSDKAEAKSSKADAKSNKEHKKGDRGSRR